MGGVRHTPPCVRALRHGAQNPSGDGLPDLVASDVIRLLAVLGPAADDVAAPVRALGPRTVQSGDRVAARFRYFWSGGAPGPAGGAATASSAMWR